MQTSNPWYESFFTGLALDALRALPAATDAEADFLLAELAPPLAGRLLDVPCGNGRLALARKGFRVTGVDISAELIAEAEEARVPGAEFVHGDMRDLPPGPFDGAFCLGNSFAYLGREGDDGFLRAVRHALTPSGRFVVETRVVAESILPQPLGRRWYPLGDLLFLVDGHYDPSAGTLRSDYTIIKGGEREEKSAVYAVYTFREVQRLAEAAGFAVVGAYGSLAREPFRLGSPGLWLVAEAV